MITMQTGQKYNFSTIIPSILGIQHNNMLLTGDVSHNIAARYSDIATRHVTIYSACIGAGIRIDPDYTKMTKWYIFTTPNASELVLPLEYIIPATITPVTEIEYTLTIAGIDSSMIPIINETLLQLTGVRIKDARTDTVTI